MKPANAHVAASAGGLAGVGTRLKINRQGFRLLAPPGPSQVPIARLKRESPSIF
jgi:hypothetical protein